MVIAVKVHIRGLDRITNLARTLPNNLQTEISNATLNYANIIVDNMRTKTLSDPKRSSRRETAAQRIRARRLSKFKTIVTVPKSLYWLDSMKAHYVALKSGRKVTTWAKDHYGTMRVSNKSIVKRGVTGNIQFNNNRKSFLYVTPHPFINASLRKSRTRLTPELRAGVRKAFRRSRR